MRSRWFPCLTVLGVLLVPGVARPADAKKDVAPTVVLRVRSIDTVIENAKFLAGLAGKKDFGEQLEGLIKSKVGPKGLEGIDTRRPVGFYSRVSEVPTESANVLLLPIADEKAFVALLENLNLKAKEDKDGLYTIESDAIPVELGFRFAHKYAYLTALNLQAVAKNNLLDPSYVFPKDQTADLSGTIRLDQIPKTVKDMAMSKFEEELAKAKEKKEPGESEAQQKVRQATIDAMGNQIAELLRNGKELSGQLDLNRDKNEMVVEMLVNGKAGSTLAKEIQELGERKSLFSGLLSKDAAMNGLLHVVLPDNVRQALEPVIEESFSKAKEKETNEAKRQEVEKLLKALEPTLTSGEFDGAFSLRGPGADKLYTLVAGVKLRQGDQLEQTVRTLLKKLPPKELAKIHLDAETVNGIHIHRIDAQQGFDKKAREMFGDHPLYMAFRADAVFVALGEEALSTLKESLSARPTVSPPLQFEMSVARIAHSAAKTPEQRKLVNHIFTQGDEGKVRVTLEGGQAMRLRMATDLSVLRFAAEAATLRRAGGAPPEPTESKEEK